MRRRLDWFLRTRHARRAAQIGTKSHGQPGNECESATAPNTLVSSIALMRESDPPVAGRQAHGLTVSNGSGAVNNKLNFIEVTLL